MRGAAKFANAEEELGGEVGFVRNGYLVLATAEEAHAIREIVPVQQALGVQTDFLMPEEVVERWPELEIDGIELACYEETSGYADPVRTVETLARSAAGRARGARGVRGDRHLDPSGRVTGVVTADGKIATGVVVNASGPWGNTIGRMVGVEYPIRFSREHEAIFHAPEGFAASR